MAFVWSSKLSVGNAIIDSEHRNLIVMVSSLESTIKAREGSALLQEMAQIEYWLCAHFNNEERIALAVGFDFSANKLAQQELLKEFHRIKDELSVLCSKWSDKIAKQYYRYLCDWMTGHIVNTDMVMKPVLKAHDYNFHG